MQLSEFLTEIVGGDSDFFQSEDLDMMGEIPLPSRSKTVEYGSKMVIASIVTLHFSTFIYNEIILLNSCKYKFPLCRFILFSAPTLKEGVILHFILYLELIQDPWILIDIAHYCLQRQCATVYV